MLKPIDSVGSYRLYSVGGCEDVDMTALTDMIRLAWRCDYADTPRPEFDEPCMRAMMAGPYWIAVLIVDDGGAPVAFEIAFERRIRCADWMGSAYYASVLSVHPDHRRCGLGRALVAGINRLGIEERGAAIIFSTFHQGHAGSPTVRATFDDLPGWEVVQFHSSSLWRRRLGLRADGSSRVPGDTPRARPVLLGAADRLHFGTDEGDAVVSLFEIEARIRERSDVAFEISADYRRAYFSENRRGGSLWCEADGMCVLVPYSIWDIEAKPGVMVSVGIVQGAVAMNDTPVSLGAHLDQVAAYLHDRGCVAVSALDLGMPGGQDLTAAGFERDDDDRIGFAARGPAHAVARFNDVDAPFFLDFT